jgi:hypothetical protein
MGLFDTEEDALDADQFAARFAQLAGALDASSNNSQKNKPLERLFAAQTGWSAVSVKYIGEENKITNRFGEARKKGIGASRYLIVLAPERIFRPILRVAEREMAQGHWDVIALGTRDRSPPDVLYLLHAVSISLPRTLVDAFPRAEVRSIGTRDILALAKEGTSADVDEPYSVAQCAAELGVSTERLVSWMKRLARKKQLVFQGPPGCGKSYIAKRIARLVVSGTGGEIDVVQFHPAMSYEDFVQGLRPSIEDDQLHYSLEPGRFMKFCERAREMPESPFVLIIDELNRANLARVFGELLYLLEYRNEAINLAQGDEAFSVPSNVHIVATMNTADRSIALVDHALRRRFSFVFLGPDYDRLSAWLRTHSIDDGGQLVRVLQAINQRIEDRHYHVGTSYFLAPGPSLPECIQDIWEGEIEPHLDEYFIEQQGIAEEFTWARLADSSLSWWATPTEGQSSKRSGPDRTGAND